MHEFLGMLEHISENVAEQLRILSEQNLCSIIGIQGMGRLFCLQNLEGIIKFRNLVRSANAGKKCFIVLCAGDIRNLMLLN